MFIKVCNKMNTTFRCDTEHCIAFSLAKLGEPTLQVRSPSLTSFMRYNALYHTFM